VFDTTENRWYFWDTEKVHVKTGALVSHVLFAQPCLEGGDESRSAELRCQ
jgi:hypothetical protein